MLKNKKKIKKTPFLYVALAFAKEEGSLTLQDIGNALKSGEPTEDGDFVFGCPGPVGESLKDLARSLTYTSNDLLNDLSVYLKQYGPRCECLSLFTGAY